MDKFNWDRAVCEWRDQELALFARRAHRRLGRGFVLFERHDVQPVYVTWMVGAPEPLLRAVSDYDPENEALVVVSDDDGDDSVTITLVKIERRH
jgi:hypothetical protein